jgi:hypothetical protein
LRQPKENWATPFAGYILDKFVNEPKPKCIWRGIEESYTYCLGFERAFSPVMEPSIMNMIGILAGLKTPDLDVFVNRLENRDSGPNAEDFGCDDARLTAYSGAGRDPRFPCFRKQLLAIMGGKTEMG